MSVSFDWRDSFSSQKLNHSTLLKSHRRVHSARFHFPYNSEITVQHGDLTQNQGASGEAAERVKTCRLAALLHVAEF
jgi:hypothetical protein